MNQYVASMDTYFQAKVNLITALTIEILMVYYFIVLWEYPAMSGDSLNTYLHTKNESQTFIYS